MPCNNNNNNYYRSCAMFSWWKNNNCKNKFVHTTWNRRIPQ